MALTHQKQISPEKERHPKDSQDAVQEMEKKLASITSDRSLARAYLGLAREHADLKRNHVDLQEKLAQTQGEMTGLQDRYEHLEKKLVDFLSHQAAFAQKCKIDTARDLKKSCGPIFERLKKAHATGKMQFGDVEALETSINDVLAPTEKFKQYRLHEWTPMEIAVGKRIKEGKTLKEIAQILNIGFNTAKNRRDAIRRKLGLVRHKTNLKEYLTIHDIFSDGQQGSF